MDPLSIGIALSSAAHAAASKIDWSTITENLTKNAAASVGKGLWASIKDEKDRLAIVKKAVHLYIEQFSQELEDKVIFSESLPSYLDQLAQFASTCGPEIADSLKPDGPDLNSRQLSGIWAQMKLDDLPPNFDWELVGKNFQREVRKVLRETPSLREQLTVVLAEQQLASVKAIEDAVGELAHPVGSVDLEAYKKYVKEWCSTLHLAIMHPSTYNYSKSLNLWNVFIPPMVREAIPVPDIPIITLARMREEGLIEDTPTEQEFSMMRQAYDSSTSGPALHALSRESKSVLLGDPGSGKSSLLKYLALEWVFGASNLIPLLVDLREYLQEQSQFIRFVAKKTQPFGLSASRIHELLQAGSAALYLDGLDEVLDRTARSNVTESIVAFNARYPRARIVVTSRIAGYDPEMLRGINFAHLTLENLGVSEIRRFLDRWYELAEEDVEIRHRNSARLMIAIETSRPIRELARNPLLLTMMAILNRSQDLPRDRVELYREATRVLLHELDASRLLGIETFARQEKEELLRELAGKMQEMPEGLTANSVSRKELLQLIIRLFTKYGIENAYSKANTLLEQLTDRNFALCPSGGSRYAFVHRTFLEYFCASWFIERLQVDQTLLFEDLKSHVYGARWKDESWHEVLRLIAGMVSDRQANDLIRYLMDMPGRESRYANLMLAAGCLTELRNRRGVHETDVALKQLVLDKAIRYDAPYYYEMYSEWLEVGPTRHRAVQLLYPIWRNEHTEAWLKNAAEADRDWIIRQVSIQEYSRIPDPDGLRTEWLMARLTTESKAAVRRSALQEIAYHGRGLAKTLVFLKEVASNDRQATIRQAALQGIARGWKETEDVLAFLKARTDVDVDIFPRQSALQEVARGWKDHPDTVSWVKAHAENDHVASVQYSAVQEYARGWGAAVGMRSWLLEKATNGVPPAREAALQEISRMFKKHTETFGLLSKAAEKDVDQGVRRTCIRLMLNGWGDDKDVRKFVQERCRTDESRIVRIVGIQQLARIGTLQLDTLSFLQDYAHSDAASSPRRAAVIELARGWGNSPEVIAWLKTFISSDAKINIRSAAMYSIARIGLDKEGTFEWLLDISRNSQLGLQVPAIDELARSWHSRFDVFKFLIETAKISPAYSVRVACVDRLADQHTWPSETTAFVEKLARSDEHASVKRIAFARLLGKAGTNVDRVTTLLNWIRQEPSRKVRRYVHNWLKQQPNFDTFYSKLLQSGSGFDI